MTRLVYLERFGLDSIDTKSKDSRTDNKLHDVDDICIKELNICIKDFYSITYFKKIIRKLFQYGNKKKEYLKKYRLKKLISLIDMFEKQ